MKDHIEDIKGFYHLSRSWYGEANLIHMRKDGIMDSITFGYYCSDGGTSGEMSMKWHNLRNNNCPSARLEVFEDSFHALGQFKDLIDKLAEVDSEEIQPKDFCDILLSCGFKDLTQGKQP